MPATFGTPKAPNGRYLGDAPSKFRGQTPPGTHHMQHHGLTLAGLLLAGSLPAQQLRTLSKPDAEFPDPFTSVSGVRELKDGRVVTIDIKDKVAQLVDFTSARLKKIGREGSGPKEYALPMALLALPGDSSLIFDPLNNRSLLVLPNGDPGDFVTMGSSARRSGGGGMMTMSMAPPRYADARGRIYMTGSGLSMGPDGARTADSLPVLRFDRSTGKTDTVAFVRQPKENTVTTSSGGGSMQVRMGVANPFAPRDEWAITPDGRVAVIRSPEYRVDWANPTRTLGAPIPYQRVKVSEGHKQAWRDSRKNATAIMVTRNNGTVDTRAGSPGMGGLTIPEPDSWPEFMPPFVAQGTSVLAAADGNIWVLRTRETSDNVPTYDVIDATGKVAYRVSLPSKTRVVGFGKGNVYTVRTDEDDLQYLQRFKAP